MRYSYHTTIRYIFTMAIFIPRLFCTHATSHKADWIFTNSLFSVLSCRFIVQHNQCNGRSWSITSRSRVFAYSIATSFLFVYNVHSFWVRLRCLFVIYLCHTHIDVAVYLLITSSIYIPVSVAYVLSFLMLNDIRSLPFA